MLIDVGKGLSFDVSDEQFAQMLSHERSKERIMYISIRNIVMDSHASVKRDDFESEIDWRNESKAVAERTLAGLLSGEVMRRNARAPKVDDFTNFARKHIIGLLKEKAKTDDKIAKLVKEMPDLPDKGVSLLDAMFAKNEAKLRPIVQKTLDEAIAAAKAKAEIASELDLDI
jgi:ribosome recycling factor